MLSRKNVTFEASLPFIFTITFWVAFEKVNHISTNNKILVPLFSGLHREATLDQFFKCRMLVARVEL